MTEIERYEGRKGTLELAGPAYALAQRIATTEFVPDALRGRPEAVLACILAGNEVGVSPMQALSKIHVIKGRPAMAAELMRAIVLAAGHELWIEEQSATRVIIGGKRKGSERETRVTWTMDDAKRAKLEGRDNWRAYPTAMLLARATAALCRAIFPDVLAGISYTVEELEDGDVIDVALPPEPGSPVTRAPAPEPTRARARRPATRGADAPDQTEPAPTPAPKGEAPLLPGEDEDEDEIIDGELVDDGPIGEDDPEAGPGEQVEGSGPSYSGPQVIAIRAGELGLDREEKLLLAGYIVGRTVESTNELESDEVTKVLEIMADEDLFAAALVAAVGAAGEGDGSDDEQGPGTPSPGGPPARRRRPAPTSPAAPGPEGWDADRWRAFLRERGVKVSELLGEANRIAREQESAPPTTLDAVGPSGLAPTLVGFVEDLSAERRGG